MNVKKLKKDQRGFTLIELLIAAAIAGFVTAGITLTIMQVFNMDAGTRNDMIAVYQVRQAGKLVSEDMLGARDVTPGGALGFPLTLTWIDWGTNYTHKVIYTLENMPSSELKRLKREYYVNQDEEFELESTTIVAEYIDPDQTYIQPGTPCSFPYCDAFTFTVTATVGGKSEARVYDLNPRPGS
jgi:prepilin-type N-terminal cleavage/methylation domain-containing protein